MDFDIDNIRDRFSCRWPGMGVPVTAAQAEFQKKFDWWRLHSNMLLADNVTG